jgi:uncharacterized protein YndB with AHSA1/START domain
LQTRIDEIEEGAATMSTYGEIGSGSNGRAVKFERHFNANPAELWAILTEPERIGSWLQAEASFEPRVGGAVHLRWEGSGECSGTVAIFDPPRTLEYSWNEGTGTSIVHFELRPLTTGGVMLTLRHCELPSGSHAGISTGWHTHLDALAAELACEPFEFWPRFQELQPHYSKLVSDLYRPD